MPDSSLVPRIPKWRQGDLLSPSCSRALIDACVDRSPEYIENATVLCIISQDCDMVADERKEPFIDLVAGLIISKAAGDYKNSKNPRCLDGETDSVAIRFSIHDKFRIPKEALRSAVREGSPQLGTDIRGTIKRWVSRRYIRAAFPDVFNERLGKGNLAKLLRSALADDVSIILIHTVNDELGADEDYHVRVIIGIKDDISEANAERIEREFDRALSPAGIVVDDLRVSTEDDITYRDLHTFKRLEIDFRSLPEEVNAAVPPIGMDAQ